VSYYTAKKPPPQDGRLFFPGMEIDFSSLPRYTEREKRRLQGRRAQALGRGGIDRHRTGNKEVAFTRGKTGVESL
jgi:hypothetical protein